MDDGVSLISAAHPRPPGPWWKRAAQRVWWWLFPPPLSEDSLETIEIEIRDPERDERLRKHVRQFVDLVAMSQRNTIGNIETWVRAGWTDEEIRYWLETGEMPASARHDGGCSNQNTLNPIGAYIGAHECGCRRKD